MGMYLNSISPYYLYKSEADSPYFVDKSLMLKELFPFVEAGNRHICITRPRRFGKTVMANMVRAFFGRGIDSSPIFQKLKISEKKVYLSARDRYRIEREDKAGKGFVDFIFYPELKGDPGLILELKVDDTPEIL